MARNVNIRPGKIQSIMGLIIGIAFVCYGLFYIIPGGGAFGIVWTLVAGVITVMNALNVFTKNGVSTATIHVSDEKDSNSVEERLKELDSLYQKNLISRDEYDENRKKILNEL